MDEHQDLQPRDNSARAADRTDANQTLGQIEVPALTLPKGGGAIRGIGEKFSANPATGSGSFSIPLPISPGRADFHPKLSLNYDSNSGNGIFGLGWQLDLPSIKRKTDKGLPSYRDAQESDEYVLSGSEELVPIEDCSTLVNVPLDATEDCIYEVHRYRPRVERAFSRIERWTRKSDGDIHWRTISKDNVTALYGVREPRSLEDPVNSRISNPNEPSETFEWLICKRFDDKGNAIQYVYLEETGECVDKRLVHEGNRLEHQRVGNRYIKRIRYGNKKTTLPTTGHISPLGPNLKNKDWHFEIVFDYGEGHYERQTTTDKGDVVYAQSSTNGSPNTRTDAFSRCRAGFEIRTYRRCKRILMFHHFDELETNDYLVKSLEMNYEDVNFASLLKSVTQSGYVLADAKWFLKKSFPPVDFDYSRSPLEENPVPDFPIHETNSSLLDNVPAGLSDRRFQWHRT